MSKKAEIALTAAEQLLWDAKAKVRVLLNLWNEGEGKSKVNQGKLTKLIARTNENKKTYELVLNELEDSGAIAYLREKGRSQVELTAKGKEVLAAGLKNRDSLFEFDGSQMGARLGNALLKWMRHEDGALGVGVEAGKGDVGAIGSYEEFMSVALKVYDSLNRDYNLDDLVPIYRMRRAIGERVARSEFNEWLLDMQANDIFQLIGGEMTDITIDKAEDSIKTELGALRYYAKRLSSKN
ncbi:MAG: hypothetical protein EAZ78_11350 [Oscillatoriales cyanobacterium]|uniref:Uncharacterized protein n=2 Tax=Microcoleus TaxID=44471 RepID=A0ABU8YTW5_9CYAN|nr:MAG: hypothetical protein EAZ98_14895 [Oscillatoriales cyanobacterium]TAF03701.1 MAG: hypothetical protein EAZ78_11350 [Oscillatoriales cyanobacterium]TAF32726.1 MAG: hypothetical protein EAZ68_20640 [Oscillatoriales cyanobacterium]TAF64843.1 MAG: hypothetical protein EAZ59_17530 [Oscillatoriales cyanobacterium]